MSQVHGGTSLHPEFSPRTVRYASDGFGRDGYIKHDNGGFWRENNKFISLVNKYDFHKYSNLPSLK